MVGLENVKLMVRNIFLDGNSFQTSRHVDKEILVGDLVFGAAATNRLGRIAVSATLRSKEFKSQRDGDCFLTVSLSF